MTQNTLVAAIVSGAMCLAIGFGSGAILTRPNREKTNAILKTAEEEKQAAIYRKTQLDDKMKQLQRQVASLAQGKKRLDAKVTKMEETTEQKKSSIFDKPTVQKRENEDKSIMAHLIAQDHIKSILKAPKTAKFPWFDYKVARLENQVYQVVTHVDSQNGFGAMIRTRFTVKLEYFGGNDSDPGNWEIIMCSDY